MRKHYTPESGMTWGERLSLVVQWAIIGMVLVLVVYNAYAWSSAMFTFLVK